MKHNMNVDLTGKKFGRWTVLDRADDHFTKGGNKVKMWHCVCDCGTEKDVMQHILMNGQSKSCGCFKKEINQKRMRELSSKHFYNNIEDRYSICGEYTKMLFANGKYCIIDTEDLPKIMQYNWCYSSGYASTKTSDGKKILLHRLVIDANDNEFVDHIDRDRTNNRKYNLRICNRSQNNYNKSPRNRKDKTIYIGVRKRSRKTNDKYVARITKDGKDMYLGTFNTEEEALIARLKAEKEYFGEFAPQRHLFEQYGI